MDFLKHAILAENLFIFFAALLTLYYSTNVIFYKTIKAKNSTMSFVIIVYLWYQAIWGIMTALYCTYIILLWRPNKLMYNQNTLYFVGFPAYILLFLNNIIEAFMGIDRCLCILFPIQYNQRIKKIYGLFSLILIIFYTIFCAFINGFVQLFFEDLKTNCTFFNCILLQFYPPYVYMQKLISVIATGVIGIIIFILMKTHVIDLNSKIHKRVHKTIIAVIASTTFFEFLPNIITQIFNKITNQQISFYIGPYNTCFVSANIAMCSWIYFYAFNGKNKTSNNLISIAAIS